MHDPGFRQQFVTHHTRRLEGRGRHARPSWARERPAEDVTPRVCTVQDDLALERLARLESRAQACRPRQALAPHWRAA